MVERKFEVHGEDAYGNLWVVAGERRDAVEIIAKQFREQGFKDVQIIENSN
jgi:hypothetical protein